RGAKARTNVQEPDLRRERRATLKHHWPAIREQLLNGTYKPQPVRQMEIPRPDGEVRKLGIPTVLHRFIQQAVMRVLQRRWDPTFSDHSRVLCGFVHLTVRRVDWSEFVVNPNREKLQWKVPVDAADCTQRDYTR